MDDTTLLQCPYCFESFELYVDPETAGSFIQDCDVCCRPIQLWVQRDAEGDLHVQSDRAQ